MDHKISCIVVDDEQLARQFVIEYLEDFDQIEIIAETGKASEAIKLIDEKKPDLIFLDVQMPGQDGFEVLEKLKASSTTRSIPVVALTAHALREDRNELIDNGCVAFFSKPIDCRTFASELAAIIKS